MHRWLWSGSKQTSPCKNVVKYSNRCWQLYDSFRISNLSKWCNQFPPCIFHLTVWLLSEIQWIRWTVRIYVDWHFPLYVGPLRINCLSYIYLMHLKAHRLRLPDSRHMCQLAPCTKPLRIAMPWLANIPMDFSNRRAASAKNRMENILMRLLMSQFVICVRVLLPHRSWCFKCIWSRISSEIIEIAVNEERYKRTRWRQFYYSQKHNFDQFSFKLNGITESWLRCWIFQC